MAPAPEAPAGERAASALTLALLGAAAVHFATRPLDGGDVFWMVRAGEEILTTGRVPGVELKGYIQRSSAGVGKTAVIGPPACAAAPSRVASERTAMVRGRMVTVPEVVGVGDKGETNSMERP